MPFRQQTDKVAQPGQAPATYRSQAPRRPNTALDVLRNLAEGGVEGVRDIATSGLQATGGINTQTVLQNPRGAANALAALIDRAHAPPVVGSAVRLLGDAVGGPVGAPPQTTPGRYARSIGRFAPNAVGGGGSAVRRAAAVVAPAVASEFLGHAAQGTPMEAPARFVGSVGGGLAAGARISPRSLNAPPAARPPLANPAAAKGLNMLARKVDVPSTQTAAERLRGYGIDPTLVDVVGETGRGIIKSAASRQTPARDAVTNFYKGRREGLPDLIDQQSAVIAPQARSADEIVQELTDRRAQEARTNYAEPYARQVEITPEVHSALSGPEGEGAIRRAYAAASARRDVGAMQQLQELSAAVQHQFPGMVTGAALDRTQIALGEKGRTLQTQMKNDIAGGYFDRQASVNSALDDVPHLLEARGAYRDLSRQMETAQAGEMFLGPGTSDAIRAAVADASPEGMALARQVARRQVQVRAGERLGAAPGLTDLLAHSGEQQARNQMFLGPEGAQRLQGGMEAAGQTLSNAFDVLPKGGSRTALNAQDALQAAGEAGHVIGQAGSGNLIGAGFGAAKLWLKTAGLNDAQSEALATMAIDPAQTDQAIAYLHSTLGPTKTQQFVAVVRQGALQQAPQAALNGVLATGGAQ